MTSNGTTIVNLAMECGRGVVVDGARVTKEPRLSRTRVEIDAKIISTLKEATC